MAFLLKTVKVEQDAFCSGFGDALSKGMPGTTVFSMAPVEDKDILDDPVLRLPLVSQGCGSL